jgi:hypothetical protein
MRDPRLDAVIVAAVMVAIVATQERLVSMG